MMTDKESAALEKLKENGNNLAPKLWGGLSRKAAGEEKIKWELAHLHLQIGDVLISKKGILTAGFTGRMQNFYRVKYLGKCRFEILGNKREYVEAKEVER